jgi:hypothetical protein
MNPVKAFCLSTVAALAVMAFAQISPATATSTQLCKVHQEPCPIGSAATGVHLVAGTSITMTNLLTFLCLSSLILGKVGGLAAPQQITVTTLTYEKCGSNLAHNNCELKILTLPVIDVLKNALNLGTTIWLGLKALVKCSGEHCVFGGPEVVGFGFEGPLHSSEAGHGKIFASSINLPRVEGFLCPAESKLTVVYESLEHLFLVG